LAWSAAWRSAWVRHCWPRFLEWISWPDPTRTGQKAINVAPCSEGSAGGSTVLNACSSTGSVTIKLSGDVTLHDNVDATVVTKEVTDTVKVGDNCGFGIEAYGSPVTVGWDSGGDVTNTHKGRELMVKTPTGTIVVPKGETRHIDPVSPPTR